MVLWFSLNLQPNEGVSNVILMGWWDGGGCIPDLPYGFICFCKVFFFKEPTPQISK